MAEKLPTELVYEQAKLPERAQMDREAMESPTREYEGVQTPGPHAPPTAADSPTNPGSTTFVDNNAVPKELADHPRYRVLELVGTGGMGAVFKAQHRVMDRVVALKVVSLNLTRDPKAIERFRREVKAAAKLSHANIVTAHDAEQAGDLHFLVMEYVAGTSLARLLREHGALSVPVACEYIRQAALGLHHAHRNGMVHRDIKPHNLVLTPEKRIKILDFGLARFVRESAAALPDGGSICGVEVVTEATPAAGATGITQIGTVMGTPDYMAPEQISNAHAADIRADIYSLGCTLYHLLTGHVPFVADTLMAKMAAQLERIPQPVREARPEVPAELSAVVAKMLAKRPEDRYQTPLEVVQALVPFTEEGAVARQRRRTSRMMAAIFAVVLGLVSIGITASVASYFIYNHYTDHGELEIVAGDPDAVVIVRHDGQEVRRIDAKSGWLQQLPSGNYDLRPADPDKHQLSTSYVRLDRGSHKIVHVAALTAGLVAVPETAMEERLMQVHSKSGGDVMLSGVAVLPDGQRALSAGDAHRLHLWDLKTGARLRTLQGHFYDVHGVAVTPDGRYALSAGGDHGVIRWDLEGKDEPLRFQGHNAAVFTVAVSADGRQALSAGADRTVRLWDIASGKEIRKLEGHTEVVYVVTFSPDGRLILSGSRDKSMKLWNAETGELVRTFGDHRGCFHSVAFSPDGKHIVTASCRPEDTIQLYDVATGRVVRRFESTVLEGIPWQGREFGGPAADVTQGLTGETLRKAMRLVRGHVRPIRDVVFSADGRLVLSCSDDTTVRLWDAATGVELHRFLGHTDAVNCATFSQDGQHILSCGDDGTVRLWKLPALPPPGTGAGQPVGK